MVDDSRKKEHGVIDKDSIRTVGMDAALARQVIREEEDLRYPLLASSLEPARCNVTIAPAAQAVLVNGIGANWSPAAQGEEAYPDDADEESWQRLLDNMTRCGIRWVRYWLQPRFNFTNGRPDAEHTLFKRFDRLHRWAAANQATLMLEFGNISKKFQGREPYDTPADNQDYVDNYLMPVLRHLLVERRYDRIRQISLFNEPFNADVKPYIFYPPAGRDPLEYYLDLHERLRQAMDRAGMTKVGLIGPDSANLFQRHIEMYEDKGLDERVGRAFAELDCHLWRTRFDYYPASKRWPGYPMTEGIERYLKPTLAAARRLGKLLSLTEVGTMYCNDHKLTARTTLHDAFLMTAESAVRSINEGVAGVMFWSYTNSGHADGQWGWIGTRESGGAPVPHLFNGFTALLRYHRPGGEIRHCAVQRSDFSSFISAAALWMPGLGETIWLINDHPVDNIQVRLSLPPVRSKRKFRVFRKGCAPELATLAEVADHDTVELVLPGLSFTTLTTLKDNHASR